VYVIGGTDHSVCWLDEDNWISWNFKLKRVRGHPVSRLATKRAAHLCFFCVLAIIQAYTHDNRRAWEWA
jgi:hypothetical protein